jgi:hypothetical protein
VGAGTLILGGWQTAGMAKVQPITRAPSTPATSASGDGVRIRQIVTGSITVGVLSVSVFHLSLSFMQQLGIGLDPGIG